MLVASAAFAQLSPGKLHSAHERLEGMSNCTKCHAIGQKVPAAKCLDCHTLLRDRIDAGRGLHANESHGDCVSCHVDHHGRDFDLVFWPEGRDAFNHEATGYELTGKHADVTCEGCHSPAHIADRASFVRAGKDLSRTFLGLSASCANCHTDIHVGQLGPDCAACHTPDAWDPATGFSHDDAEFTLTGAHRSVDCQQCHRLVPARELADDTLLTRLAICPDAPAAQLSSLEFAGCASCHADVHDGRLGPTCADCHQTSAWHAVEPASFDHERTRYPLRGQHRQLSCDSCHSADDPTRTLQFDACSACHADRHDGQFANSSRGTACESCHTVDGFSPATFTVRDHEGTSFALHGAHLAIPCAACHTDQGDGEGPQFTFADTRCESCHSDPHRGKTAAWAEGGCEACHGVAGWESVEFDHTVTGFALTNAHASVACVDCHAVGKEGRTAGVHFADTDPACSSCHNDIHRGQFREDETETQCRRCHVSTSWLETTFVHDRDTAFPLTGAHKDVACRDCHSQSNSPTGWFTLYASADTTCESCHATDASPRSSDASLIRRVLDGSSG